MQIHELNTFAGTPGADNFLAIDNGVDTGKITGENLLSPVNNRLDNIVANVLPNSVETLATDSSGITGTVTLSKSVNNFNFLDFYFKSARGTHMGGIRIPVSHLPANITVPFVEPGDNEIYEQEFSISASGTSLTANGRLWEWSGRTGDNASVQSGIYVVLLVRVDGINTSSNTNAELTDARTGANGITYASAGAAIRGQYSSLRALVTSLEANQFGELEALCVNGYDPLNTSATSFSNSPYVFPRDFYDYKNVLITRLQIPVRVAGTISVGYINKAYKSQIANTNYNENDLTITNVVDTKGTGFVTIDLPNPFIVPDDCALFIGMGTDTAAFYYGTHGEELDFFYVDPVARLYYESGKSVNVNFLGVYINDYSGLPQDVAENTRLLNILSDGASVQEDILYNGFDPNNTSGSGPATSPFVMKKDFAAGDCYLTSIRLNVSVPGTVTVGAIKKTRAHNYQPYNYSDLRIFEVMDLRSRGDQTYILNGLHKLYSDEYLFLNVPTDTGRWNYGPRGVDLGFQYVSSGVFVPSVNSLGVTVNVEYIDEQIATAESTYRGKRLSILGDSISTFAGYIPEGNATYYPSGTVQAVSDTWWYKLYTALDMVLDTNNSWSGSRVTTTGGSQSAGCGDRCEALGSPDVIIVWIGINDFNNEVALGTYDGASAIPSDTTKFREAYGIMLNKILTKYQTAEVWVCTLPQCERNSPTGFPEVNQNGVALVEFNKAILELATAFGVKVLDHNKCGLTYQNMPTYNPDNLHPNKQGHSLVANNDIRQMDNFVRTRY